MDFRINMMKRLKTGLLVTALCTVSLLFVHPVVHAEELDQYGGMTALSTGTPAGYFGVAKFGTRWMFVDPLGNAYFAKGADLIKDIGGTPGNIIKYGNIRTYDAASLIFSSNLNVQAENITPNDVVNDRGVTVQFVGDTIYIGHGRPFNDTYFNVTTLGSGGQIQWYYSAPGGLWKPINGTGKPSAASKLNTDGSYNLDIGNYLAPDSNGIYGTNTKPNGNLVNWWKQTGTGVNYVFIPPDFVPATVNGDTTSLYYIKGVVTRAFAMPPKVGQTADLTTMYDAVPIKYGKAGTTSAMQNWYNNTMLRMKAWGLNLAGDYSNRIWQYGPLNPTNRVPEIITWQLSGDVMEGRYYGYTNSTAVKGLYDGVACVYPGKQADVFDPNYAARMYERASVNSKGVVIDNWVLGINPDEGDWIFGLNSSWRHQHVGFVVLVNNPYKPAGKDALGSATTYADATVYSKYALADYLRYQYRAAGDPIPAFTVDSDVVGYYNTYVNDASSYSSQALRNLNTAWGMSYSAWGSNGGWGAGSGFMDESSTDAKLLGHIAHGCSGTSTNPYYFTTNPPAIASDLDGFAGLFTTRYGKVMQGAVKSVAPNTMIGLFIYQPPDYAAKALGPYADFFEISPQPIPGGNDMYQETARIYNGLKKPVLFTDYLVANY